MKHSLPPAKNLGNQKDEDAMAHYRHLQSQGKAPMDKPKAKGQKGKGEKPKGKPLLPWSSQNR